MKNYSLKFGFFITLTILGVSFLPKVAQAKEKSKASGYVICKGTPIPKGFVVQSETSGECSGGEPSAWIIDFVGVEEDVVCRETPIPDDYVVVSEVDRKTCPAWGGVGRRYNAWKIEKISR